ncbi:AAA family ATPase [Candidatus Micrarchaeota archaeon]|nr:AAA family ATPase [Candidatus Micrarchaeota archaeon]
MVYIKSLRLKGFKSFRHSNILFNEHVTAIAGPNGSGKSNIIDAVRFVFGETSLKSLRAKRISSLISHSSREAAVTLVIETGNQQEVELKRLISSSGKAKYKVNGKTVKRYVMLDLLRQYNLALGEHNVIAQGMVQKFVEMNPKERRAIIDDIAGIAEFDSKKTEAVRELDEVQRRIDDANIVLSEREGYLKELEKEKEDALKYREAETMYKRSKGSLLYQQMEYTDKQLKKLMGRYVELKKQKETYNQDIIHLEKKVKEISAQKEIIVNKINENSEQQEQLKKLEEIHIQITVDKQLLISLNNDVHKLDDELKSLEEELNKVQSRFDETSKNLWKFEKEAKESQIKLKTFESIEDEDGEISTLEMQMENYIKKEKQLIESQGRLEAEIKGHTDLLSAYSDQGVSANDLMKLKNDSEEYKKEIQSLQRDIENLFEKEKDLNKKLPDYDRKVLELKEKIAEIRPFIGKGVNPAIPFIENLKESVKGIHGPIIDLIDFEDDYSSAVTAAGGGRLYHVVVDNIDVAATVIKKLKARGIGRATFIPLDKITSNSVKKIDVGMGNILNYIKFDPEYTKAIHYVFGETVLVKDIESAKKHVNRNRMVTLGGELFDTSGAVTGGRSTGITAVKNFESYNKKLESTKIEREACYSDLSDIRERMNSKRRERAQLEVRIQSIEAELKIYKVDDFTSKISDIKEKTSSKTKELEDVKKELSAVSEKISQIKNQVGDKADSIKRKRTTLLKQRDQINERLTEIKSELASMKKEKNMLTENLEGMKKQKNNIIKSTEEKQSEMEIVKNRIKKNEAKEKTISDKVKEISKEMESFWNELRELDSVITDLSSQKGNLERKMERISGELNGFEIQKATLETRLGDLRGDYEEFKDYPLIEAGENRLQEIMVMYEGIINSLGNVNLKAPEIYEEKKNEMDEIRERITKLEDEKKAVYRMINEIEQRKKAVFIEVFNSVNNKFKELYSRLVMGESTLVLDDENKPFESGLRIKVTMNNKETYLESMSGGERTLLSIILILAIQMVRPSPFYLMDEVDAALDKENSKLLAKLISDMSKNSQFVVVTHNDGVLKYADAVLGVSRDEKTGSKVVGIKVKEEQTMPS